MDSTQEACWHNLRQLTPDSAANHCSLLRHTGCFSSEAKLLLEAVDLPKLSFPGATFIPPSEASWCLSLDIQLDHIC